MPKERPRKRMVCFHETSINPNAHILNSFVEAMEVDQQTFIVGRNKLEAGQVLSPDPTAYDMFHALSTPWPCLSFDIVKDGLGDNRKNYPATMYAVAGTQAESARARDNSLMVMKFSGLSRMDRTQEDSDSSDDEDEDADPILESTSIPLTSTTNRIRAHQIPSSNSSRSPTTLTASMMEDGKVLIHDVTPHLNSFDIPGTTITPQQNRPLSTLTMHGRTEGYALAWAPRGSTERLITGDNNGHIYLTERKEGEGWASSRASPAHTGSIEDLQWSPKQKSVFASTSSDGTVRIWDTRSMKAAITIPVSNVDVNVMSWSYQQQHLLATGDDNGTWAVWDMRHWETNTKKPSPVASFDFHKEQITSIEWHPTDDSIVAVAAGDDTLTLWDLGVELDDEESKDTGGNADIPPQLLFVHYMEKVKECHWHPQIPGVLVGTGEAFNVFKTISV